MAFDKLQPIKPLLGETKLKDVTKRRAEIVLHRARIGHTHLTHGYLMRAEEQPQCETCKCSLSVEHILLNCVVFANSRRKYFVVGSLKELFTPFLLAKYKDFCEKSSCIKSFRVNFVDVYCVCYFYKILDSLILIYTFDEFSL